MLQFFAVKYTHPLSQITKEVTFNLYLDLETYITDKFWQDVKVRYIENENDVETKNLRIYERRKGFEEFSRLEEPGFRDKLLEKNKAVTPVISNPPVRKKVASTSIQAHQAIVASKLDKTLCDKIWLVVLENGDQGMTCREIGRALNIEATTISPRLTELKNMGRLLKAGPRKCKVTDMTVHYVVAI